MSKIQLFWGVLILGAYMLAAGCYASGQNELASMWILVAVVNALVYLFLASKADDGGKR